MKKDSFENKLIDLQNNMQNFASTLTSNEIEAKELVQDTTLLALNSKDKYLENVNFKGWVFTIMRNIFINNYRKIVRTQILVDQSDNINPIYTDFNSPEVPYPFVELTRILDNLDDEYRVPFTMYTSGFKYIEIAEKLDLPLGTVKSRIFFVKQKLREFLKESDK